MALLRLLLCGLLTLFSPQVQALANPNVAITVHNIVSSGKDLFVYVAGYNDPSGSQSILQNDGSWAVLNAGASVTPVKIPFNVEFVVACNSSLTLTLPSYVNASRLYVVEGIGLDWEMVVAANGVTTLVQPVPTTPGTVAYDNRWGFIEFTSGPDEFFVNLSFVDFVSLPIGISGTDATGTVYTVPGLMQYIPGSLLASHTNITAANVTRQICLDLEAQAQLDGNPWGKLCVYPNNTGSTNTITPLRILSPQQGLQQNTPFANPSYYETYIAEVWSYYTQAPLYIDTQKPGLGGSSPTRANASSIVTCHVDAASDHLVCSNTSQTMPRPTTPDVWGCNSGAFALGDAADAVFQALVPRVCAAFTRSTLLVEGGDVQPGPAVASFYGWGVTNHFARVVHAREVVGGYAFAYDDVAVEGAGAQDGAIMVESMEVLNVYVGG